MFVPTDLCTRFPLPALQPSPCLGFAVHQMKQTFRSMVFFVAVLRFHGAVAPLNGRIRDRTSSLWKLR
jgi:hypothetical protein